MLKSLKKHSPMQRPTPIYFSQKKGLSGSKTLGGENKKMVLRKSTSTEIKDREGCLTFHSKSKTMNTTPNSKSQHPAKGSSRKKKNMALVKEVPTKLETFERETSEDVGEVGHSDGNMKNCRKENNSIDIAGNLNIIEESPKTEEAESKSEDIMNSPKIEKNREENKLIVLLEPLRREKPPPVIIANPLEASSLRYLFKRSQSNAECPSLPDSPSSVTFPQKEKAKAVLTKLPGRDIQALLSPGIKKLGTFTDSVTAKDKSMDNTTLHKLTFDSQNNAEGAMLLEAARKKRTSASHIKVVARFRPLNAYEIELMDNGMGSTCVEVLEEKNCVHIPKEKITLTLDHAFGQETGQAAIYEILGKATIQDVLKGYNGTIFAYGQTGSGKTYTMFGLDVRDPELKGIIPRSIDQIFNSIRECTQNIEFDIRCSMLELYMEKLRDLLRNPHLPEVQLKIKESPTKGIYVSGLSEICVSSEEEVLDLIERGNQLRHIASTRSNEVSSRSHSIFILQINQKFANESEKRGVLNLVDLAGSEKVGKTGAVGQTLEEAKTINWSLSAIGNVIHALVFKTSHVPYRDSKLTRILQESLGGNYKSSLVVACSMHSAHLEETISTLRFANRTRSIQNQVKINVKSSPQQLQAVIDHLTFELSKSTKENLELRTIIQDLKAGITPKNIQSLNPRQGTPFRKSAFAEKEYLSGSSIDLPSSSSSRSSSRLSESASPTPHIFPDNPDITLDNLEVDEHGLLHNFPFSIP